MTSTVLPWGYATAMCCRSCARFGVATPWLHRDGSLPYKAASAGKWRTLQAVIQTRSRSFAQVGKWGFGLGIRISGSGGT